MDSTVYTSNKRGLKGVLISLIVLALVIGAVIWGSNYLKKSGSPVSQTSVPATKSSNTTVDLPIPLNDPAVKVVGVTYYLSGKVGLLRPIPDGEWELTFMGPGGNMVTGAPLIVTEKTPVTKDASGSARMRLIELKNEDPINVNYFYDPLKKKGQVTLIQLAK